MKLELPLTEEQVKLIGTLMEQAAGGALAGQIRRREWPHPQSGQLFLHAVVIKPRTAEKMRAAFVKAETPKKKPEPLTAQAMEGKP